MQYIDTDKQTRTHTGLVALAGTLNWLVKIFDDIIT